MTASLTPGLAQAALELIRLLQRRALTTSELLAGLRRIEGMATADALELAQTLNWLSLDAAGILNATVRGRAVAGVSRYDHALREIILDYVDILHPSWLQNAPHGRARVLAFAGIGIAQSLVEAGVTHGSDEDVVAFWDALAARARGQIDDRMLAIGRAGERLTLAFEARRTGAQARWVAIDSNDDGFDILSRVSSVDSGTLTIEVKTSSVGLAGQIHLTRGEWLHACDSPAHAFHLWDLLASTKPRLAIITPGDLSEHVSTDQGSGLWQEVRIPFRTFADRFEDQAA